MLNSSPNIHHQVTDGGGLNIIGGAYPVGRRRRRVVI